MNVVGRVAELWRYPVKSLRGEPLQRARFGENGIPGDRGWALQDVASGRIISGKRLPQLLRARAIARPGAPCVELPGAPALSVEDPAAAEALSRWIGRAVRFVRAPQDQNKPEIEGEEEIVFRTKTEGTFFDAHAVHLVTTATLRWLRSITPASDFDARRFRPNLVIECDGDGPVEQDWIGAFLHAGSTRFRLVKRCERCVMTTAEQGDLQLDKDILRTVARSAENNVGIYGLVEQTGSIDNGDEVSLVQLAT